MTQWLAQDHPQIVFKALTPGPNVESKGKLMIAAGGVLLLMLVGFALEGLFSGSEEETGAGDGSDAPQDARDSSEYDASVYTSDLHDLLFGDDGMGNPGDPADGEDIPSGNILDDLDMSGSDGDTTDPAGLDAGDPVQDDAASEDDGPLILDDSLAIDPDDDTEEGSDATEDRVFFGTAASDALQGGAGHDALYGDEGDDDLSGGAGDDTLEGGAGADTLDGGNGDDTLELAEGDEATGGEGADLFTTRDDIPEDVPILTDFMPGVDSILVRYDGDTPPEITFDTNEETESTAVFSDGAQILHLDGTTGLTQDDVVLEQEAAEPMEGDDALTGTDDDDTIDGGGGGDTIDGGGGDDTIDGLDGDDLLNGGTGDDILRGRAGMDELFGQQGNDALTGGYGDDLVSGGSDNDLAFGNEGNDTVNGEAGNDELYGNSGDDTVSGGDGQDLLHGGEGHDSVSGDNGDDLLYGAGGDDTLTGGDGDDYLIGGFGTDDMEGGAGNDTLDGTFTGGDGAFGPFDEDQADTLSGGDGDDHLFLGQGDAGIGGAGADTFESGSYIAEDADAPVVTDFDPAEDRVQISVDLESTPDPEIAVVDFADGTGADVVVDGTTVLRINGAQGLDPDSILVRDMRLDDLAETA